METKLNIPISFKTQIYAQLKLQSKIKPKKKNTEYTMCKHILKSSGIVTLCYCETSSRQQTEHLPDQRRHGQQLVVACLMFYYVLNIYI